MWNKHYMVSWISTFNYVRSFIYSRILLYPLKLNYSKNIHQFKNLYRLPKNKWNKIINRWYWYKHTFTEPIFDNNFPGWFCLWRDIGNIVKFGLVEEKTLRYEKKYISMVKSRRNLLFQWECTALLKYKNYS